MKIKIRQKHHYKALEHTTESGVKYMERPTVCDEDCDLFYDRCSDWDYEGGNDCIMQWDEELDVCVRKPGLNCPGDGCYELKLVEDNDDGR